MYLCINCNAQGVERKGDEFKCPRCKYEWNVAHEQANAAYLASQGRKPVVSLAEQAEAVTAPENALMKELGLVPDAGAPTTDDSAPSGDEEGADVDPGEEQPPATVVPDDALLTELGLVPDLEEKWRSTGDEDDDTDEPDAGADGGYHINVRFDADPDDETELDSELVVDVTDVTIRLETTTVPLLKEKAEEHEIDLTGAPLKADIIERLLASGKLTAVFSVDGELIDVE